MRTYATVQKLLCHGTRTYLESCASIMYAVVCRLPCFCFYEISHQMLFIQEIRPNPRYFMTHLPLPHKHHSIIHVGADLIQFVYGLNSKRGYGGHFIKNSNFAILSRDFHGPLHDNELQSQEL